MTNLVILAGNIGQQPESRTTFNGTHITRFSLATSRNVIRDGKSVKDENGYTVKETEWHRITCFAGLAETIMKHCDKGMKVQVQGRIHYQKWTGQDGTDRYGTEIIAEKIDFLSRVENQQPTEAKAKKSRKTSQDEVPF